ncbi:MAG TPA: hypothetical protein PK239_19090, partial [Chitinophagales bacterium]|nr:hypothetical protein [Chitinophagales bacterium]
MKKLFSSLYFQVLVFSIVVGAMPGCGSWFAKRQGKENQQTKTQTRQPNTITTNEQQHPIDKIEQPTSVTQVAAENGKATKPTFTYDNFTKKYTFPYLPTDTKRLQDVTEKVTTTDTIVFAGRQRFFKPNMVCMDADDFIKSYHSDLGLGEHDELRRTNDAFTPFGQFHKGVRVAGAGINIIYNEDCIDELIYGLASNININTTPTLTRIEALQSYLEKYAMPM